MTWSLKLLEWTSTTSFCPSFLLLHKRNSLQKESELRKSKEKEFASWDARHLCPIFNKKRREVGRRAPALTRTFSRRSSSRFGKFHYEWSRGLEANYYLVVHITLPKKTCIFNIYGQHVIQETQTSSFMTKNRYYVTVMCYFHKP